MKVFEQLAEAIADNTDQVFGLIGDGNLFMVNHYRNNGGTYVSAYQEANAVMMAYGYARASGNVGFATVTHGPGLTNTVTALIETKRGGVPVVVLVGDTPRGAEYLGQDIDQPRLFEGIDVEFTYVESVEQAAPALRDAFVRAVQISGPVVVNVPRDLMWQDVDGNADTNWRADVPEPVEPDSDQLDVAMGILASAHRPIVLGGRGARDSRAELVALAEALGGALATSVQGNDLFHGEPSNIGIAGSLSTDVAIEVIAESDCIVAFGASLNPKTTDKRRLFDGKAVIHVDVDESAFDRYLDVDAAVTGDTTRTALAMAEMLDAIGHEPSSFAASVADRVKSAPRRTIAPNPDGPLSLAASLRFLDERLPWPRTVVTDAGLGTMAFAEELHAPDARSQINSLWGFEAIGLGVGTAIGAAVARPDRVTVLAVGDGSFMLGGLNDFRRVIELGLDVVCIVCNNRSYAAEHIQFTTKDMDPDISMIDPPDFAAVARAFGAGGVTVTTTAGLEQLPDIIEKRTGPLLVDLQYDASEVFGIHQ